MYVRLYCFVCVSVWVCCLTLKNLESLRELEIISFLLSWVVGADLQVDNTVWIWFEEKDFARIQQVEKKLMTYAMTYACVRVSACVCLVYASLCLYPYAISAWQPGILYLHRRYFAVRQKRPKN